MSLQNALSALDALAAGQTPDLELTLSGLLSLDLLLLQANCEQAIRDASSTLELLVAGVTPSYFTSDGKAHLQTMAEAVRRAIDRG